MILPNQCQIVVSSVVFVYPYSDGDLFLREVSIDLTVSYLRQLNEDMLSRSVLLKLSSHYSNIDSIDVVDLNVQVSSYLFNGSSL